MSSFLFDYQSSIYLQEYLVIDNLVTAIYDLDVHGSGEVIARTLIGTLH